MKPNELEAIIEKEDKKPKKNEEENVLSLLSVAEVILLENEKATFEQIYVEERKSDLEAYSEFKEEILKVFWKFIKDSMGENWEFRNTELKEYREMCIKNPSKEKMKFWDSIVKKGLADEYAELIINLKKNDAEEMKKAILDFSEKNNLNYEFNFGDNFVDNYFDHDCMYLSGNLGKLLEEKSVGFKDEFYFVKEKMRELYKLMKELPDIEDNNKIREVELNYGH